MKRISAWFDGHPKTRIALQLTLDGLPLLMVLYLIALIFLDGGEFLSCPEWANELGIAIIMILLCGGGLVVYGCGWWLKRAFPINVEEHPVGALASRVLRVFSFIPAMLPFFLTIIIRFVYAIANLK